ncbi:hypothetical protein DIPPA_10705 [Diplonema papillatum]|nr:hypothetical protein DIPPA_10705 [Diplonema papillatum]
MTEKTVVHLSARLPGAGEACDAYFKELREKLPTEPRRRWAEMLQKMAAVYKEDGKAGVNVYLREVVYPAEAEFIGSAPDDQPLKEAFSRVLPRGVAQRPEPAASPRRKRPLDGPAGAPGKKPRASLDALFNKATKTRSVGVQTAEKLLLEGRDPQHQQQQRPPQQQQQQQQQSRPRTVEQPAGAGGRGGARELQKAAQMRQVRVVCPPCPACSGLYDVQEGKVNGQPWWAHREKPEWKLFSSPAGIWTITGNAEDLETGRGMVAAGTYHDGMPPYYDEDEPWQCAALGCWRPHDGIKVTSTNTAGAVEDVVRRYGRDGVLSRRAFGRLLRFFTGNCYMASPKEDTWVQFCGRLGCDPKVGIPEDVLSRVLSAKPKQTPSPDEPVHSQRSYAQTPVLSMMTRDQEAVPAEDPSLSSRCGKCRACQNPRWHKTCEDPPNRQPQAAPPAPKPGVQVVGTAQERTEVVQQFERVQQTTTTTIRQPPKPGSSRKPPAPADMPARVHDPEQVSKADAVAQLLGLQLEHLDEPKSAPPRKNRAGFAPGVPIRKFM